MAAKFLLMPLRSGAEQGCAVAVSDKKHQVILSAGAFGSGDERPALEPMVKQAQSNYQVLILSKQPGFPRTVVFAVSPT